MADLLLIYAVYLALAVMPLFKLLPHFGFNRLWALLAILPVGLLILLWVMAARVDGDTA